MKRYDNLTYRLLDQPDGRYVLHEDAEAKIARLTAERDAARDSQSRMHARAQLAEQALPEWRVLEKATSQQATGRMYPALLRFALSKAKNEAEEAIRQRNLAVAECKAWRCMIHLVDPEDPIQLAVAANPLPDAEQEKP